MATLHLNYDLLEDRKLDIVSGGYFGLGPAAIVLVAILICGSGTSNHQENKQSRPDGNGLRA